MGSTSSVLQDLGIPIGWLSSDSGKLATAGVVVGGEKYVPTAFANTGVLAWLGPVGGLECWHTPEAIELGRTRMPGSGLCVRSVMGGRDVALGRLFIV